jgi:hypothetical protein
MRMVFSSAHSERSPPARRDTCGGLGYMNASSPNREVDKGASTFGFKRLRTSVHSLCRLPIYLIVNSQLLTRTRTNTDSTEVARKDHEIRIKIEIVRDVHRT